MNRQIEGTRTQQDKTAGNAVWETPPEVYAKLNEDFGPFDIDLTADAARHHHKWWFGPQSPLGYEDALTAPWHLHGTYGFSNPPYGDFIPKILFKAWNQRGQGFTSTLLLPMRVTKAFKTLVLPHASDLLFADSRIVFHENGQPRWNQKVLREQGRYVGDPAMFDSIIVRFNPHWGGPIRVDVWKVPVHGKWKAEYEVPRVA